MGGQARPLFERRAACHVRARAAQPTIDMDVCSLLCWAGVVHTRQCEGCKRRPEPYCGYVQASNFLQKHLHPPGLMIPACSHELALSRHIMTEMIAHSTPSRQRSPPPARMIPTLALTSCQRKDISRWRDMSRQHEVLSRQRGTRASAAGCRASASPTPARTIPTLARVSCQREGISRQRDMSRQRGAAPRQRGARASAATPHISASLVPA